MSKSINNPYVNNHHNVIVSNRSMPNQKHRVKNKNKKQEPTNKIPENWGGVNILGIVMAFVQFAIPVSAGWHVVLFVAFIASCIVVRKEN